MNGGTQGVPSRCEVKSYILLKHALPKAGWCSGNRFGHRLAIVHLEASEIRVRFPALSRSFCTRTTRTHSAHLTLST